LLNEDQLHGVFLNLPELMSVSGYFTKRLQATTGLDQHHEPIDYKVNNMLSCCSDSRSYCERRTVYNNNKPLSRIAAQCDSTG